MSRGEWHKCPLALSSFTSVPASLRLPPFFFSLYLFHVILVRMFASIKLPWVCQFFELPGSRSRPSRQQELAEPGTPQCSMYTTSHDATTWDSGLNATGNQHRVGTFLSRWSQWAPGAPTASQRF